MRLSDRDKKLLLILLLIAVIALPYYFLIQPALGRIELVRNEVSRLDSDKNRLENLVSQVPAYNAAIEEYLINIEEILKRYPRELPQEKSIIFIDETEKQIDIRLSSVALNQPTINRITVGFEFEDTAAGQIINDPLADELAETRRRVTAESAITIGESSTGDIPLITNIGDLLSGIRMEMNFAYSVPYREFKEFLNYILTNQERHVISSISANFSPDIQIVSGNFTMNSYAIYGFNRPAVDIREPQFTLGTLNIFMQAHGLFEDVREAPTPDE